MILVFGKGGQVGRELARARDVLALDRDEADLGDPAACAAKIRELAPSLVINAAAFTAVDGAEAEEPLAQVVNGAAPGAMAVACAEWGIPFLHISTDYVFDGAGEMPWAPGDAVGPLGAYGRSKLAGEWAVAAAGGGFAILRTSWVFSAHGRNFVTTMLRLGAARGAVSVVADQVGGPTAAADVARALFGLGHQMLAGQPGGIYHYSGAPDVSWAGFAREIFDQAGMDVEVSDISSAEFAAKAARPANSRLQCSDLQRDFGIARPDWWAGLADVLAALR